jgi:hypothetical protein
MNLLFLKIILLPKKIDDYDEFPNKVLLDKLRSKIIQSLIDNNVVNNESMTDFIKAQIDKNN